jgi:hypothetical protein
VPRGVYQITGTKNCGLLSQTEDFGNRLVVVLTEASHRVFWSTLQGLNQLVVGLSPLSETTYSTGHEIPNDGS